MRLKISLIILIFMSVGFTQNIDPNKLPKIGIVSGLVIDSVSNIPIQYASVSLISKRNNQIVTGGITESDGKFTITEIPVGKYDLSIEFIGYKRVVLGPITLDPRENSTNQNLGKIRLVQTSLSFNDINVEGERPLFSQTMEKKIFNVEQNNLSAGGSALDVLRQVPGIDVDIDGNVSLRGSANINILIDGKPANMTGGDSNTILENITSDNIKDIEVVTNPSAKYDPEGMAGIINIILKENRFEGINGSINSGISTLGSYNASGQLNFRNNKLNLFSNIGLRHDVRGGSGDNYRETDFIDYQSILDQVMDGERGGDNIFIKSGVEYFLNPQNIFGLTATYRDGNRINNNLVITDEFVDTILKYEQESEGNSDRNNIDLSLAFDRKFDNPKQKLTANYQISRRSDLEDEKQLTTVSPGYEALVYADSEKSSTENERDANDLQVDYTHPFGSETKLELGYKGTIRGIDNLFNIFDYDKESVDFILDDSRSSHFLYDENIQAGYAVFSTQRGIIGLQMGLRAEMVNNTSELRDTNEKIKSSYTSYFPSFSLASSPTQIFQYQLSYSRRINRPSYRSLNPSIHTHDQYSISTGNPFLNPEYIDIAEFNILHFKRGLTISIGTYLRYINNKMSRYKYIREDGVSISTYENFNSQKTYGFELILSGTILKKIRVMLNGNMFADEVNASNVFDDYDKTSTGYISRFTGTWNVSPTMELMIMGFYRSPRDLPFGRVESMSFASISARKKLLDDRLSVSLNIIDVLNSMRFKYTTIGENYFQESLRKRDNQSISLQLEYKFGSMEDKSSYNRNRDQQNSSEDNGGDDFEIE